MTIFNPVLISVDPTPHKTHTSYGGWSVGHIVTSLIGDKTQSLITFFWTKKDALKWIESQTIGTPPTQEEV